MAHRVVIAGAGLAGGVLAARLAQAGHSVELLERRADPRGAGAAGGRSINLAISVRGLAALREIGLEQAVLAQAIPMRGRMIHARSGETVYQPYSADPTRAINSVSRSGLNRLVIDAAERAGATIRFERRCVDVDLAGPAALFVDERGAGTGRASAVERVEGDLVVACDGAYSAVRAVLQRNEGFDYSQSYLSHGYRELTIPPTESGDFAMPPEALHIWPRGGFMMIALPNPDRSFTCTLFVARTPADGTPALSEVRSDEEAVAFMRRWFPDAVPLMPNLVEEFRRNPVGAMVTIRCRPWHRGRVVLLGDAAHAIVPFYGQGANCAFEDCSALAEALEGCGGDLDGAIARYEARRIENANAIADLALINFIEMRDRTASPWFRARKRAERLLSRLFPGLFVPLYDLVSFSTVPYAAARRRARRQWWAVGGAAAAIACAAVAALFALRI